MFPLRHIVLLHSLVAASLPLAAQKCAQSDLKPGTQRLKAIQSQLLGFKVQEEMDEGVPPPLQTQIGAFKDAFASLADAALECTAGNVEPKTLEKTLVKLLDANKPVVQEVYDPKKPPQLDRIYGADLSIKFSRPRGQPQILLVEFRFGIACGFDSLLLAYEPGGSGWKRILRWQTQPYDLVNEAFGDFIDYEVLPQIAGKNWLIVVAHGMPWCTSNMSAFDIDLLQPSVGDLSQRVLDHKKLFYRREEDPVMKPEPDGFEMRATGDSIDGNIIMRPVIFRLQLVNDRLERVQPIALNGRDFVDEWLQSPWSDAARWSAARGLTNLEQSHRKLLDLRNASDAPLLNFGPVRKCSGSAVDYEVELDENWVNSKGASRQGPTTYFQIEEGKNSFTMLSASPRSDASCIGPDIMPKE